MYTLKTLFMFISMIIINYLFVTFSGAGLARFYSENK